MAEVQDDITPTIRYSHGETPPDPLSVEMVTALQSGETQSLNDLTASHSLLTHADVKSILIVPIRYQTRSVGLILLHGSNPAGFEASVVDVILSLAAQAAIALGDAYLYEEQQYRERLFQRKMNLMERLLNFISRDPLQSFTAGNPRRSCLRHPRGNAIPGGCDQYLRSSPGLFSPDGGGGPGE